MITASHNPVEDNGLKICDGDGGMLVQSWEKLACDVANAEEAAVAEQLQAIRAAQGITSEASSVYIAMDTRPSSRVRSVAEQQALRRQQEVAGLDCTL